MEIIELSPSGIDDTQALQEALSSGACVRLNGYYSTTKPLVMEQPTKLEGDPVGSILYRGPLTEDYSLTVRGQGAWLRGITMWCQFKCRGIKFVNDWYTRIGQDVRVYDARQLALDLVDCWAGNFSDFMAIRCRGIGMRTHRCNSVSYDRFRFCLQDLTGDDWPAEIPADQRAVLVTGAEQGLTTFSNILFEPCQCGPYPLWSCRSGTTRMQNIRIEGGKCAGPLFRIHGDGWKMGTNIAIEDVFMCNLSPAESLAKLTGKTMNVSIRNVMAGNKLFAKCLLDVREGTHKKYLWEHVSALNVPEVLTANMNGIVNSSDQPPVEG